MPTLKSRTRAVYDRLSYSAACLSGALLYSILGWTHPRHQGVRVWAPAREARIIREAIDYLIKVDPQLYLSLATKWQPTLCYSKYPRLGRLYKLFFINDSVLAWEPEGVASYILYALLTLQMLEDVGWPHVSQSVADETARLVWGRIFEWSTKHGVSPELCDCYLDASKPRSK